MNKCPCGSSLDYSACCGPFLAGDEEAPSAEALMRSRYTAYTKGAIDYIKQTNHKSTIDTFDEEASRRWSRDSEWLGLKILSVKGGGVEDREGEVEFVASYVQDEEELHHHERATFKREGRKWFFVDGEHVGQETYVRETPKVGRNEPCPCGSGKKYKKCCANK
jgi:SEC-C motif-containing protein